MRLSGDKNVSQWIFKNNVTPETYAELVGMAEPLTLSLDVRIQHILREEVSRQIESFKAIGGAGVLLNANSGEVLGMVSLPDFDPAFIKGAASDAKFNDSVRTFQDFFRVRGCSSGGNNRRCLPGRTG